MRDNRIIIESQEIYEIAGGRRNTAAISGEIVVKSLDNFFYDIDVSIPGEFPFAYELDDIRGVVSGELHIEGDTPPLVTGNLNVVRMDYHVNFAEPGAGSPVMTALSGEDTWDLDIDFDIQSNYWIRNEDIDAEFSGDLWLLREDGAYRFVGEMEILRGKGYLLDKVFTLDPGSSVIFEGNELINPRLDIIARSRIVSYQTSASGDQESVERLLEIHIGGTLEEPDITPTENSDFSREDILPLIVANTAVSDTASVGGSFARRMASVISARVSQIATKRLGRLGVETFEIDPYYGGDLDPANTRVSLGYRFGFAPKLYLYGHSTLSGQSSQEVGFEYRFNRSFLIQGVRDEDELYHMNVKLHWEF